MKYRRSQPFIADYNRLSDRERTLFKQSVRQINEAFARRGDAPLPRWPAHLRIRPLAGHPGVFEMTWSFAGPDGRATFELIEIEGEIAATWRRVGGHEIFGNP